MDENLIHTNTRAQNGPGNNGTKKVLYPSWRSRTGALPLNAGKSLILNKWKRQKRTEKKPSN